MLCVDCVGSGQNKMQARHLSSTVLPWEGREYSQAQAKLVGLSRKKWLQERNLMASGDLLCLVRKQEWSWLIPSHFPGKLNYQQLN